MRNDLNSKVDNLFFYSIVDDIETELENKADKTIASKIKDGLMSFSDKLKLDNIEKNANNYIHPSNSGNKHIPSGGTNGQILKWNNDGSAIWSNPSIIGVSFSSEDEKVELPGSGSNDSSSNGVTSEEFPNGGEDVELPRIELSSEGFPGGGEINIPH